MPSASQPDPDGLAQRLHADVSRLPMLPAVLLRLARLDPESAGYFDEVLGLINADPGFAVRLLNLANSTGGGALRPATSVSMALIRVGARGAVELMLAESASRIFPPVARWQRHLWTHAVLAAGYMRRLAPMVIDGRIDPNEAYLCGLLHDIGRFVMFAEMPDAFEAVELAEWDSPQTLVDAERALFGCTHAELGYLALQQWGLPQTLAELARDHHAPEAPGDGAQVRLLRDVDWIALRVARDGADWLQQSAETFEAESAPRMHVAYRGDVAHRLATLRTASAEAQALMRVFGMAGGLKPAPLQPARGTRP